MSFTSTYSTSINEAVAYSHTHTAKPAKLTRLSVTPPAPCPALPDRGYMRPPRTGTRKHLWKARMWIEGTAGFSVLEPWEQLLFIFLFILTSYFIVCGLIYYLPDYIFSFSHRLVYYVSGMNGEEHESARTHGQEQGVLAMWVVDLTLNLTRHWQKLRGMSPGAQHGAHGAHGTQHGTHTLHGHGYGARRFMTTRI